MWFINFQYSYGIIKTDSPLLGCFGILFGLSKPLTLVLYCSPNHTTNILVLLVANNQRLINPDPSFNSEPKRCVFAIIGYNLKKYKYENILNYWLATRKQFLDFTVFKSSICIPSRKKNLHT